MRSDLVFEAVHTLRNRYMLCQLASKATRKFHRPNTRIQDTTNQVLHRIADAADFHLPQRPQREVPRDQPLGVLADYDRSRGRDRLQPRRQAGRMADRRVLGVLPRFNRPHHHLARIRTDPHLQINTFLRAQPLGEPLDLLLHP